MQADFSKGMLTDLTDVNPSVSVDGLASETSVSFIPMADVSDKGQWVKRQTRKLGEVRNGYTAFKEGDVLFAKITPCMENGKGCHAVGLENGVGFGSTEFHILRAKSGADARFVFHWSQSEMLRRQAEAKMIGSAGQQRVPADFFETFEILLFESDEQRRIAEVLDAVDAAIRRTDALINKLKWMKAGLLQDLLTRGLGGDGKLRDPARHPDEFEDKKPIGLIPKRWEVVPLKQALDSIATGKSPSCLSRAAGAGEWGVLKVSAIRPEGFRPHENKAVLNPLHINEAYEVKDGDLLISRANTYELVGLTCLVHNPPSQLMLCDKTLRLNVNKSRALPEFIFHVTQTPFVRTQIEIDATGSSGSMKNISQDTIESLLIPLPELTEQELIIRALSTHDSHISIEETNRDKLIRIKKGLMHDLLTGRVRVPASKSEVVAV